MSDKPITSLEELRNYCIGRASENRKRSAEASARGEERWHAGKADTYERVVEKIDGILYRS